eukprot:g3886.t1
MQTQVIKRYNLFRKVYMRVKGKARMKSFATRFSKRFQKRKEMEKSSEKYSEKIGHENIEVLSENNDGNERNREAAPKSIWSSITTSEPILTSIGILVDTSFATATSHLSLVWNDVMTTRGSVVNHWPIEVRSNKDETNTAATTKSKTSSLKCWNSGGRHNNLNSMQHRCIIARTNKHVTLSNQNLNSCNPPSNNDTESTEPSRTSEPFPSVDENTKLNQKSNLRRRVSSFMFQTEKVESAREEENYMASLETFESLLKKKIVHPEYPPKAKMDLLVAAVIVYSVNIIPYRIAFEDDATGFMMYFDYLCDCLFAFDLFVSFRTAYYSSKDRAFICIPSKIAYNYLTGWFTVDFLSTVPFDKIIGPILVDENDPNNSSEQNLRSLKLTRSLRLIRLLKMARVLKLGKVSGSIEDVIQNPALLKMISLTFQMLFISHVLGCIWFMISAIDLPDVQGWPIVHKLEHASRGEQYVASLYWAFTTMTTVGYGDVVPTNTNERIYVIFAQMAGTTIFGYIVGSIVGVSDELNFGLAKQRDSMKQCRAYWRLKNVPKPFKEELKQYYEHYYEKHTAFNDQEILFDLPRGLREMALLQVNGEAFQALKVLDNLSTNSKKLVAERMRIIFTKKGQIIAKQDELVHEWFQVIQGEVIQVRHTSLKEMENENFKGNKIYTEVVARVIKGGHIGLAPALMGWPNKVTSVAGDHSWLMVLSKKDLAHLVEYSPEFSNLLQNLLLEVMEKLHENDDTSDKSPATEDSSSGETIISMKDVFSTTNLRVRNNKDRNRLTKAEVALHVKSFSQSYREMMVQFGKTE